mgnify:CR=1 FL=1|jgi:hypothetical protein
MIPRNKLFEAWSRYYSGASAHLQGTPGSCEERARSIRARMMELGRSRGYLTKQGFRKREIETALGMSLGVHKQLLAGGSILAQGGYNRREAGGNRLKKGDLRSSF